jgi:AcrR family transcriptional regulator
MARKSKKKISKSESAVNSPLAQKNSSVSESALLALASSLLGSGVTRSDFRKAQILESVINIASQEGFEAISFDRIGKELGLQKSNVAYYFLSKEDMIQKSMHFSTTKIFTFSAEGLAKADSAEAELRAYLDAHFRWIKLHFNHACFLLYIYLRSPVDEFARNFTNTSRVNGRQKITQILQKIAKNHDQLKKHEMPSFAEFIQDQLTGTLLQLIAVNGGPTHKQVEEKQKHLERMLSIILKIRL